MAKRPAPTARVCKDCGNAPRQMDYHERGAELFCRECVTSTGTKRTMTMAINFWNRNFGKKAKR